MAQQGIAVATTGDVEHSNPELDVLELFVAAVKRLPLGGELGEMDDVLSELAEIVTSHYEIEDLIGD